MIKNVIFDIGDVLIRWNPKLDRVFDGETAAAVEEAIFGSKLWDCLDLGVEEDAAIFEKMCALAPSYRKQVHYVLAHLDLLTGQQDYAKGWIRELKEKGYHVYFLSNYSRHLRQTQPQVTDFVPLMDGGIFSSDVQLVKPDRRIYALLCERYQLVPGECLFIDDRQDNVTAAVEFGMQSIRFDGYEQSYGTVMQALGAGA
jgi:putative hydrolase of the HAD superfamily